MVQGVSGAGYSHFDTTLTDSYSRTMQEISDTSDHHFIDSLPDSLMSPNHSEGFGIWPATLTPSVSERRIFGFGTSLIDMNPSLCVEQNANGCVWKEESSPCYVKWEGPGASPEGGDMTYAPGIKITMGNEENGQRIEINRSEDGKYRLAFYKEGIEKPYVEYYPAEQMFARMSVLSNLVSLDWHSMDDNGIDYVKGQDFYLSNIPPQIPGSSWPDSLNMHYKRSGFLEFGNDLTFPPGAQKTDEGYRWSENGYTLEYKGKGCNAKGGDFVDHPGDTIVISKEGEPQSITITSRTIISEDGKRERKKGYEVTCTDKEGNTMTTWMHEYSTAVARLPEIFGTDYSVKGNMLRIGKVESQQTSEKIPEETQAPAPTQEVEGFSVASDRNRFYGDNHPELLLSQAPTQAYSDRELSKSSSVSNALGGQTQHYKVPTRANGTDISFTDATDASGQIVSQVYRIEKDGQVITVERDINEPSGCAGVYIEKDGKKERLGVVGLQNIENTVATFSDIVASHKFDFDTEKKRFNITSLSEQATPQQSPAAPATPAPEPAAATPTQTATPTPTPEAPVLTSASPPQTSTLFSGYGNNPRSILSSFEPQDKKSMFLIPSGELKSMTEEEFQSALSSGQRMLSVKMEVGEDGDYRASCLGYVNGKEVQIVSMNLNQNQEGGYDALRSELGENLLKSGLIKDRDELLLFWENTARNQGSPEMLAAFEQFKENLPQGVLPSQVATSTASSSGWTNELVELFKKFAQALMDLFGLNKQEEQNVSEPMTPQMMEEGQSPTSSLVQAPQINGQNAPSSQGQNNAPTVPLTSEQYTSPQTSPSLAMQQKGDFGIA